MLAFLVLHIGVVVAAPNATAPNIVWFLTDDQDQMLGSSFPAHNGSTPMGKTQQLLVEQGTMALNFFAHTPICCPSRSELLTGRYFHNLKMVGPAGCMHANDTLVNANTFAKILHRQAGYTVGLFGKYINTMPKDVPPGFDAWLANEGGTYLAPQFFTYNIDGLPNGTWKGTNKNYTTAVVGNASIAWIRKVVKETPSRPFFAYIAPKSAHEPYNPAPWYEGHWDPSWPAHEPRPADVWNASFESRKDKHGVLATNPMITSEAADVIAGVFQNRWRTLMSVDDVIAAVMKEIENLGLMDSTYFFFSSDHGFQLGEFNILMDKRNVYDTNTRVHFLARGPGITPNTTFQFPATHVDVAPTFLALAGIQKPADMDGKSMVALFIDPARVEEVLPSTRSHLVGVSPHYRDNWRDTVFFEYYYNYPNAKCVNDCNKSCGQYPEEDAACTDLDSRPNTVCWTPCCTTLCYATESNANNFIALRGMPNSAIGEVLYAEFQTGNLDNADIKFERVDFCEYYNASADPWQIYNLYNSTEKVVLEKLHNDLQKWFACVGDECP